MGKTNRPKEKNGDGKYRKSGERQTDNTKENNVGWEGGETDKWAGDIGTSTSESGTDSGNSEGHLW